MSLAPYLKIIGRSKEGARALERAQAAELMGQLIDGSASDLEVGAFCLAMRIKGETPEEMAGFLDALQPRLHRIPTRGCATVVLPSYNGARKLPVLTPLLALLLARQGLAVVVHGSPTETGRVTTREVWQQLGLPVQTRIEPLQSGSVQVVPTELLCPGLVRLLEVRRVVGLRNPAHSLVKLLNPCDGPACIVGSYTHPEYAASMRATFMLTGALALLLRGTEGEPVADARRTPAMERIAQGQCFQVQSAQVGALTQLPQLPAADAASTARWIAAVLQGQHPVPPPIALQVNHIVQALHPA